MKVLFVVVNGHLGGGQLVALKIAQHLVRRGEGACVLSPNPGQLTQSFLDFGIPVFFQPMRKTYHIQDALAISRLMRAQKIDILHTHSLGAGNILSRLGGFMSKRPVISHIHGENNFNPHPWTRRYQMFLERVTLKASRKIIAVSERTKQRLASEQIDPQKIEVIPNGVEIPETIPDARESVRKEFSLPKEAAVVVCVAQLCESKGQNFLIEALSLLKTKKRNSVVIFVGEDLQHGGQYRQQLANLAAIRGVSTQVRFAGSRRDVSRLLQASDFLVLPSLLEGLPMVILEAMASSRPVIATKVGGIPELVEHGRTGFLVDSGQVETLAEAMASLLENPSLSKKMGDAGLLKAHNEYPVSAMLDKILRVYGTVLSDHGTHRN